MSFLRASPSCINHLPKAHILISSQWGSVFNICIMGWYKYSVHSLPLPGLSFLPASFTLLPQLRRTPASISVGSSLPFHGWVRGTLEWAMRSPMHRKNMSSITGGLQSGLPDPRLFVTMLAGHVPRWSPWALIWSLGRRTQRVAASAGPSMGSACQAGLEVLLCQEGRREMASMQTCAQK